MKTKVIFAFTFAVAVLAVIIAAVHPRSWPPGPNPPEQEAELPSAAAQSAPAPAISEPALQSAPNSPAVITSPLETRLTLTNKLERLNQIRETFHALAAGDPARALRAAKEIADDTERETALFTLVTEWTNGELGSPRRRARAIGALGIEAGLGIELAKNPELATLWANELTEGPGRTALLQQVAFNLVASDPASAFAMSDQLPESERRHFLDSVFENWGGTDTEAALNWAGQLADPAERDAALNAIRMAAPVGIGAALRMQDGYAVINQLLPGTPAEQSAQLHPGDRIVALAQGDNSFVDARNLPLAQIVQMVRGAPNTLLQLRVLPADAPQDSSPRTVSIFRDQLRFKR